MTDCSNSLGLRIHFYLTWNTPVSTIIVKGAGYLVGSVIPHSGDIYTATFILKLYLTTLLTNRLELEKCQVVLKIVLNLKNNLIVISLNLYLIFKYNLKKKSMVN